MHCASNQTSKVLHMELRESNGRNGAVMTKVGVHLCNSLALQDLLCCLIYAPGVENDRPMFNKSDDAFISSTQWEPTAGALSGTQCQHLVHSMQPLCQTLLPQILSAKGHPLHYSQERGHSSCNHLEREAIKRTAFGQAKFKLEFWNIA
jgi:hypothetical protein